MKNPADHIIIKGASNNNLKHIDLALPRNKFIVLTGLSGSGKSSLAYDTLYAEGKRRYSESLNVYARQFFAPVNKPKVEYIQGLPPAIALEQKNTLKTNRSTIGTTTEINDHLDLLYSKLGIIYSPTTGEPVVKDTITDVMQYIKQKCKEKRCLITYPLNSFCAPNLLKNTLEEVFEKGFVRILVIDEEKEEGIEKRKGENKKKEIEKRGKIILLEPLLTKSFDPKPYTKKQLFVLLDRLAINTQLDDNHLSDTIETAFKEGQGTCIIFTQITEENYQVKRFCNVFGKDNQMFETLTPKSFSFNTEAGKCKKCNGLGWSHGIVPEKVIKNTNLSIEKGVVEPWEYNNSILKEIKRKFIQYANKNNFPINKPYKELSKEQKELLWKGNSDSNLIGIHESFGKWEYSFRSNEELNRYYTYFGEVTCPECKGSRLNKITKYVKINGYTFPQLLMLPLEELLKVIQSFTFTENEKAITKFLLEELTQRINFMIQVGLGYLHLNRTTFSLSGGEYQRMKLTNILSNNLVDTLYILDEPTIGLHPKNIKDLSNVLLMLRDKGNSVVIVEHEEEVMKLADEIIDIGPRSGSNGGEVVFQGNWKALQKAKNSLTADYITGRKKIPLPKSRKKAEYTIQIQNANVNNLKNIDVTIPLNSITVITGVSGSGKSSLVHKILYPKLEEILRMMHTSERLRKKALSPQNSYPLSGNLDKISHLVCMNQDSMVRTSRANPATYTGAYEDIRILFGRQAQEKSIDYKAHHFSFNTEGGRCENCSGTGSIEIDMQFMANVSLTCEECEGKRFKQEILDITYQDKNIFDVLQMTIDDAIVFFEKEPKIIKKLLPLQQVGLGYLALGQNGNYLSGGEAQRVKLASFIVQSLQKKNQEGPIFFIFDEPTTGLHFHDIQKLLDTMQLLIKNGHTVLIIEHNMEIIKSADWLIDLGPKGGNEGGHLLFQGQPEEILKLKENATADYLRTYLE